MLGSFLVRAVDLSGKGEALAHLKSRVYRQQILFFHVPKCGGTSLSHYFRLRFLASHFRLQEEPSAQVVSPDEAEGDTWMTFKRNLFLYHALAGTNFVQGHVPYDPVACAPLHGRAHFLTLLRAPEDRVISHYYFDSRLRRMPFGDFLRTHRGRAECSVYCRFFGGLEFGAPEARAEHRDAAIDSLRRFSVVGILEEEAALERQLRQEFGVTLKLPRRNVGSERRRSSTSDGEIEAHRSLLREQCEHDTAIYQEMKRRALGA